MKIIKLHPLQVFNENAKLRETHLQFEKLLDELRKRELPDEIVSFINKDIEDLNAQGITEKELRELIRKRQSGIITTIEKKLKIVPVNYYRNLWIALGMASFGLPIGVVFGLTLGNMAFIGIGLPIGIAVGLAIGTGMDKKAKEEGRQLDIEIK